MKERVSVDHPGETNISLLSELRMGSPPTSQATLSLGQTQSGVGKGEGRQTVCRNWGSFGMRRQIYGGALGKWSLFKRTDSEGWFSSLYRAHAEHGGLGLSLSVLICAHVLYRHRLRGMC